MQLESLTCKKGQETAQIRKSWGVTYGILYGTLEVAVCDEIPNVPCKL